MNFMSTLQSPFQKFANPREDGSAGGFKGGMPSRPSRSVAPPPARSEQSTAKKFSFPFRRKNGRAQNQNRNEDFFAGHASEASGGGAVQSFRSKWVRAKFRIEHQMRLPRFLGEVASPLRGSAWWLCARLKAIKSHGAENEKEAVGISKIII